MTARQQWTVCWLLCAAWLGAAAQSPVLGVRGTDFALHGRPFEFTGVRFFNAIYNAEFNRSEEARREWLRKFRRYGVNVLRVWAQWDNRRGFVDACAECSLFAADGLLRGGPLAVLKGCSSSWREAGGI